MQLSKYQEKTNETATYPKDTVMEALAYTALGCTGEAGELANKVKKIIRGDHKLTYEVREAILNEVGDVLWYLAQITQSLGADLDDVANNNLAKLEDRRKRNKIMGEGDYR